MLDTSIQNTEATQTASGLDLRLSTSVQFGTSRGPQSIASQVWRLPSHFPAVITAARIGTSFDSVRDLHARISPIRHCYHPADRQWSVAILASMGVDPHEKDPVRRLITSGRLQRLLMSSVCQTDTTRS